jgi:hypothetical protein
LKYVKEPTNFETATGVVEEKRYCLNRSVFVLSLDFLRNQCVFFVWIEKKKKKKSQKKWSSTLDLDQQTKKRHRQSDI